MISASRRPSRRATPGGARGPRAATRSRSARFAILILLLLIGLLSGKGEGGGSPKQASSTSAKGTQAQAHHGTNRLTLAPPRPSAGTRVALSLQPSGPVYVCLIDDDRQKRIPGADARARPYTPRTYHATRFDLRSATTR